MPKIRPTSLALAALLTASTTAALAAPVAKPGLPGPAFPTFANAEALKSACDTNLASARQHLLRMEQRAADGRWLAAYDAFNAQVEDLGNPLQFLSAVHPEKSLREASEACELRWNDFYSSLGQNEKLFQAARRLKPPAASRPKGRGSPRSAPAAGRP